MNPTQEQFSIYYEGREVAVTTSSNETNTSFVVHLPAKDLQLNVKYIDDNPVWVENGVATERSEKIGRLIEEYDGR